MGAFGLPGQFSGGMMTMEPGNLPANYLNIEKYTYDSKNKNKKCKSKSGYLPYFCLFFIIAIIGLVIMLFNFFAFISIKIIYNLLFYQ